LAGAGGELGALTFTLLWNSDTDLDLHFMCDYTEINYFNKSPSNSCGAFLDVD